MRPPLPRWLVRAGMTLAHRIRRFGWRHSRRPLRGVRAIVLAPDGRIVLVRHSYTQGWHLPAGGVRRGESAAAAIRRELGEEIGLEAGAIAEVEASDGRLGRRPHALTTFLVRDAQYRPRWSLEIEAIGAFARDALPPDLAGFSRRAIERHLGTGG